MTDLPPYQITLTLQGRLADGSGYGDAGFATFMFTDPERFQAAHDLAYDVLRHAEQQEREAK